MDADQVGRLTARWVESLPGEGSTVVSGLGVWPLLAILAEVADEPARTELAEAAGGPYAGLLQAPELRIALGLWTRPDIPLQPDLDRLVPPEVRGVLTDQATLDAWVTEKTGGLLNRMPIELTSDLLLLLASALALETTWRLPFGEGGRPVGDVLKRWLSRLDHDLETIRRFDTAVGPLTAVTVRGVGEFDVRLFVGRPDRARNAVLAAALRVTGEGVGAAELLRGVESPAVVVVETSRPEPSLHLSLPYFEVRASHDLLSQREIFGLKTATDCTRGHFPGLSPAPLCVTDAQQTAMAEFSARGFKAAAVTAIGMSASGRVPEPGRALSVDLDQPFAFIAVHRPTGIPVVAGWVAADAYRDAERPTRRGSRGR
ncbi:serpin family protein [Kribbella sp. NPDC049174]|uniref:serpin family protein n=1 Tax=Kribbella sp. NPDC049174 TaxID=3364112 RepID=UPI0037207E6E